MTSLNCMTFCFEEQKYSFLGILPEKRINKFYHNFTCKTIAMIQLALGEKIVEVVK